MSALYVHLEPADDPAFVLLRTSASPNPERKQPVRIKRIHLDSVLLMLLDAASRQRADEAATC
ncbi:hypothetical protein LGN17_22425 [Burkholderia sp. AU30280]|uniref:hypothetical protein n=1 Tax=Burkholderia sp. AU30280 TaxID=2879628 RepID=UPI001CF5AC7A|nr:hypothetical protein [Burkholderia sp. AU30280]MCA8275246.1 hypothetical protein [Burkholderia sp. AU30280]